MKKKLIIGSRGSKLALWQANYVQNQLHEIGIDSEIKIIKTKGDKIQDIGFEKMEGKGFFTKEIEEALLTRKIDIAVHSYKDLPTSSPDNLTIAAVSYRENPSDLLLISKESIDSKKKFSLKINATVGTSSARRRAQLHAFRSDITLKDLRGNVPTRIKKLKEKHYDAIIIAAAGIERLEIDTSEFHVEKLSPTEFIPAPAQGVLAIQIRRNEQKLQETLRKIHHQDVKEVIAIEREVLRLLEGGCQLPIGVYCEKTEDDNQSYYKVWAVKSKVWNEFPVYIYSRSAKAEGLAKRIVGKLTNIKPASVFITRDIHPDNFLIRALQANGYTIHGHSLIKFKKVPFTRIPKTDWIFFSSKNAVKYFFEQKPTLENVKYGTIGRSTAEALREFGQKPDFIGYSTDTKLTGKQFVSASKGGSVLFPQAKGSLRVIQQQFIETKKVFDLTVYETAKNESQHIPDIEIIVFTSPSNVQSFFKNKKVNSKQKVVAMGNATANELKKQGIIISGLPESFDDKGLVQAIFGL